MVKFGEKNMAGKELANTRSGSLSTHINSHPKLHRTLASFSALLINTYIIIAKSIAPPYVELSMLFWLMFFITTIIAAKEKDASYCFTPMVIATTPFIVWGAGLSIASVVAVATMLVTIGFQRGVTMNSLASSAGNFAHSFGESNLKKKIIKLADSDIEPDLLKDEDLKEFAEVEGELLKVKKEFEKSSPAMQNALKTTLAKVEHLQKDHARVLTRSAGLSAFLEKIDLEKLKADINKLRSDAENTKDSVAKAQLEATTKMKEKRITELDRLDTCLNRVKIQKMQIHEMFSSLMDKLNTLKFTDVITLQASSDAMFKEVDEIRTGLEDLEKGLIEAEQYSKV
jgi:hypothetical protein